MSGTSHRPRGFTLFEVAISAGLVATAVVTVFMMIPIGLRAQQQARFRLYAGCKVLEMIDTFANHDHTFATHQIEAEKLGQSTMPSQWPVDLDRMMISQMLGLLPLPDAIAARIDSDGDEIQRILADGGRLYYASPIPYEVGYHQHSGGYSTGTLSADRVPPPEAQGIVFAVLGYAQQNALPNHPCLAWPYSVNYPSVASNGRKNTHALNEGAWEWQMWAVENRLGLPPTAIDDFKAMCDACPTWEYNGLNSWQDPRPPNPPWGRAYTEDVSRIQAYLAAALDLVQQLGIPTSGTAPYLVPDLPMDLTAIAKPWLASDPEVYPSPAKVSAIRWLAAGALMRTGWWTQGVWPLTPADEQYAKDLQECAMAWARRYAATDPYDWGAPRALNRCSAWDFPLLEYDLFAPHPVGDGTGDLSWDVTAPRQPRNYARGYARYGYGGFVPDNHASIDASWARSNGAFDTSHFNLTARFAAAERCRQIVCWAVDWRAYEDFESAQSGPYDGSVAYVDSRGAYVDAEIAQHPPDLSLAWSDATRSAHVPPVDPLASEPGDPADIARRDAPGYRASFFGLWGVDRNGNGVYDRGPLPASARIRALSVGRWNYYDRRMITALRN